ncbi:MAG TPA: tetratricopeptide repeat protein [Calditrichia bacterium]|nr:hypothetical protein [Calditrichota bacterium]HQV32263.1 tetratricopeptide repeat protein [Calditrichia bacterium]
MALSREFQELQLFGKAEETLLLALEKMPDHPSVMTRLANLYLKLDMPEKALTVTDRLMKVHPDLPLPFYLAGRIQEEIGERRRAIDLYRRALTNTFKDRYVLVRMLPLLIQQGRESEALMTIETYQKLLDDKNLYAEYHAQALLGIGKNVEAFNKMREALMVAPRNEALLTEYLSLSIQISKKSPKEVYHILNLAMPNLYQLPEKVLLELELDYLIYHNRLDEATAKLDGILAKEPESYHWRRKRAMLMLEKGQVEESIEAFRVLFLQHPTDVEVRKVLENYFIVMSRVDHWKNLIQISLQDNEEEFELFSYFRSIGNTQDWLAICEMNHEKLLGEIVSLFLPEFDLEDETYLKLPAYALEIFISKVAIHNSIISPADLWKAIAREREKKDQVPPFQIEDLEAAYPVWLFVLNIYFLFKERSEYPVTFTPAMLQNDAVAVSLTVNGDSVEVDLNEIMGEPLDRPVIKLDRGRRVFRWSWPRIQVGEGEPQAVIPSVGNFADLLVELRTAINKQQVA